MAKRIMKKEAILARVEKAEESLNETIGVLNETRTAIVRLKKELSRMEVIVQQNVSRMPALRKGISDAHLDLKKLIEAP